MRVELNTSKVIPLYKNQSGRKSVVNFQLPSQRLQHDVFVPSFKGNDDDKSLKEINRAARKNNSPEKQMELDNRLFMACKGKDLINYVWDYVENQGVNPNDIDRMNEDQNPKKLVESLLRQGANPNVEQKYGLKPLHTVENPELADLLIKAGAHINVKAYDFNDTTPLHIHSAYSHTGMVRTLVNAGADVKARTYEGQKTPADVVGIYSNGASKQDNDEIISLLKQASMTITSNKTSGKGFDRVAGMKDLKALLKRDVMGPLENPEKYKKYALGIPNGMLMVGPPGCGKTYITKALSEEMNCTFLELDPSSVGSSYIHQTSQKIAEVFKKAEDNAPAIIFIDEIEAMAPSRANLGSNSEYKKEEMNTLLTKINECADKGVLVIGATNEPELLDNAMVRAGRFDKLINVGPPDKEARKDIIKQYVEKIDPEVRSNDINYEKLAKKTKDFASADLKLLVNEAAREALGENEPVSQKYLVHASEGIKPIDPKVIQRYEDFAERGSTTNKKPESNSDKKESSGKDNTKQTTLDQWIKKN